MAKMENIDLYDVLHPTHRKQQEHTFEYNMGMYERLPYERDNDLCNPRNLRSHPAKIYRYYTFDTKGYKIKVPKL